MHYFLSICLHQVSKVNSHVFVLGVLILPPSMISLLNTSSHNFVQKLLYGGIYCQQILKIFFIFFCISNSWDCVNLRLKFALNMEYLINTLNSIITGLKNLEK